MHKRSLGVTIVELLVVVAVVGILATLATIGFGRYQAETRDARRTASVTAITEALERYFEKNGEYPGCELITSPGSTLVANTLTELNQNSLLVPGASAATTNSIRCAPANTLELTGEDFFEYSGDASDSCQNGSSCLRYTLRYRSEVASEVKSIDSRHNATIASSGASHLSVTSVGFTSITLGWTSVPNALSYSLQRSSDATFDGGDPIVTVTGTTRTVTGLSQNTTYYFRVWPNNADGAGTPSNIVQPTTTDVGDECLNVTVNSTTQTTASWCVIAGAVTYTLQQALNEEFTSPTSYTGLSGNSRVNASLSPGTTYNYRVQAALSSGTSPWSNIATVTTPPLTPTLTSVSVASATSLSVAWTAVSPVETYRVEYSLNSDFSSPSFASGITGTSTTLTGLSQGRIYYVRVVAVVNDTPSANSNSLSATTPISEASGSFTVAATRPEPVYNTSSTGWVFKPGGTGNYYTNNARITANPSCASGTTKQYRARGRFSDGGWQTATSWGSYAGRWYAPNTNSGYGVRFQVAIRCITGSASSPTAISAARYVTVSSCNGSCSWGSTSNTWNP